MRLSKRIAVGVLACAMSACMLTACSGSGSLNINNSNGGSGSVSDGTTTGGNTSGDSTTGDSTSGDNTSGDNTSGDNTSGSSSTTASNSATNSLVKLLGSSATVNDTFVDWCEDYIAVYEVYPSEQAYAYMNAGSSWDNAQNMVWESSEYSAKQADFYEKWDGYGDSGCPGASVVGYDSCASESDAIAAVAEDIKNWYGTNVEIGCATGTVYEYDSSNNKVVQKSCY